ncbi:protein PIH1D3 [Cephus cinctus]|uniref:Protein PIH1D3 n=1 Tax=Cephus cinctus TaxID=211228 RepID=A0AAJ7CET8_CEPCN|nr:protein PIH1D3 [Cephus cinctus]XP_015608868.1 protein PIH1D3 [Cephus cinctus]XP_015608886.1 protein PIH1D3 [Cephus cinctus]XP_024947497.1 protein PIH1D3 [Cephus cinctus]XP_024947502.1 protein PIH1D3 [Cephus cinctus]
MDGCFSYKEIKALQELISPQEDVDSDTDDDDLPQAGVRKLGPADIGAPTKVSAEEATQKGRVTQVNTEDIWQLEEINRLGQTPEVSDPRQVPEYEMKFKQAVSTEDVFLGMNYKTPGSASCEWITVSIKLPGETRDKVELNVESDSLDIRSPKYRLHLLTPHAVEPNQSSAKWHVESSTLEVTLRLTRELDTVNF